MREKISSALGRQGLMPQGMAGLESSAATWLTRTTSQPQEQAMQPLSGLGAKQCDAANRAS